MQECDLGEEVEVDIDHNMDMLDQLEALALDKLEDAGFYFITNRKKMSKKKKNNKEERGR